ncbi:unnamed protein product, partial [Prorocentrum cordatum]
PPPLSLPPPSPLESTPHGPRFATAGAGGAAAAAHPGPWCSAAGGGGCRQDHAAELERFAAASGAPTSPTTGSGQRSGGSLTHDEWVSQAFSLAEGQLRACRGGLGGR